MAIGGLDHVTVRCADLGRSRAFYAGLLGLEEGERPPFDFPGAWFYAGGRPVVHLVAERPAGEGIGTGPFDHVAFQGANLRTFVSRLVAAGASYELRIVPRSGLRQVFLDDPDGIRVEINFAPEEALPEEAGRAD